MWNNCVSFINPKINGLFGPHKVVERVPPSVKFDPENLEH